MMKMQVVEYKHSGESANRINIKLSIKIVDYGGCQSKTFTIENIERLITNAFRWYHKREIDFHWRIYYYGIKLESLHLKYILENVRQ